MTSRSPARLVALATLCTVLCGCGGKSLPGLSDLRTSTARVPAAPLGFGSASPSAGLFSACPRTAAAATTTHLAPVPVIDGTNDADPAGGTIPHGVVRLEHAGDLVLPDGRLGAGSGYAAATGTPDGVVRISRAAVTAPVTVAVLDSPTAGRRVAYVEVRVLATQPVTWREESQLAIGTDGGDGGFVSGTARALDVDDPDGGGYIDAFYPDGDSGSGNVCVLRKDSEGAIDAVLFSTGYGDGGYPTYVGRDRSGRVASVISFGYVLPWKDSGLPGTPPPADDPGPSPTPVPHL